MRLLLTILLFTSLSVSAQELFVKGKKYTVGFVVFYPTNGVYWISKKAFTSASYPAENSYWTRYYYPSKPEPVPVTTAYARQSAFDSLLARVKELEAKKPDTLRTQSLTFKISQYGTSLFKQIDDSTYAIKALVFSKDGVGRDTDSTLNVYMP
jgi:hypothetical protein